MGRHKETRPRSQFGLSQKELGHREYINRYNALVREEVFTAYGGKCVCCGETEPGFLTIDHMANNGAEHRRSLKSDKRGIGFYKRLRRDGYPIGYQLLCFNCNCAKARFGECPHKREVVNV